MTTNQTGIDEAISIMDYNTSIHIGFHHIKPIEMLLLVVLCSGLVFYIKSLYIFDGYRKEAVSEGLSHEVSNIDSFKFWTKFFITVVIALFFHTFLLSKPTILKSELSHFSEMVLPSNTFYINIGDKYNIKDIMDSGITVANGTSLDAPTMNSKVNYTEFHIESIYCNEKKHSCRVFFKMKDVPAIYEVDLENLITNLIAEGPRDRSKLTPPPTLPKSNDSGKADFTSSETPW